MQTRIVALVNILERMETLYLRVYEMLASEREALVQLDYEKIYEVLVEKDEIISVLRSLDAERLKLQDQLSILLGLSTSDINLKEIAERISLSLPELSRRLMSLRSLVNQRIALVTERIATNRTLIDKSVKNLQDIAKNLSRALSGAETQSGAEHGTYDGKAKYSSPKTGSGSLVRKQL